MKIKNTISVAALAAFLLSGPVPTLLSAQNTVTKENVKQLVSALDAGVFADCSFGVEAEFLDGVPIVSHNAARRLNPASNMKVVTTAAALRVLGRDFRWYTTVAHDGSVDSGGVLHGNLYIIGGGDPTLGAENPPRKAQEMASEAFDAIVTALRDAGISGIDGCIAGDGSWIEGMREDRTWSFEDLGTYYGTCVSGLNFYENRKDFEVTPGVVPGDSLTITPDYPPSPWMRWRHECSTGKPGTGDNLYLYTPAEKAVGTLRGTYAAGRKPKTVHCRNNYPEYTFATQLLDHMLSGGIRVSGVLQVGCQGPLEEDAAAGVIPCVPDSVTVLYRHPSLPLSDVVYKTNRESDNFYAEILFRTLGRTLEGSTAPEASARALEKAVSGNLHCPCGAVTLHDGSGLSIRDRLTPAFICSVLRSAANGPDADVFRRSLVKYGGRCTLKTGTFTGCRCLSGYIAPSSPDKKTIVFSIMVNNSPLQYYQTDKYEKQIINALAALN